MKKHLLILSLCCLLLSSCAKDFQNFQSGLENFHSANSDHGLCDGLIPDDFIDLFEYMDGTYYKEYTSSGLFRDVCERSLVYFEYDDITYNNAKSYAIENLILDEKQFAEYGGYSFFTNKTREHDTGYPRNFKVYGYNDENNTLVFLGFYVSVELYEEVDALANDWPAFLEKYYGEWYSFS